MLGWLVQTVKKVTQKTGSITQSFDVITQKIGVIYSKNRGVSLKICASLLKKSTQNKCLFGVSVDIFNMSVF